MGQNDSRPPPSPHAQQSEHLTPYIQQLAQRSQQHFNTLRRRCGHFKAMLQLSLSSGDFQHRMHTSAEREWRTLVNTPATLYATLLSAAVGLLTYRLTLRCCSSAMLFMRLSSDQRWLARTLGFVSVFSSGVAASQAFITTTNLYLRHRALHERLQFSLTHPLLSTHDLAIQTPAVITLYGVVSTIWFRVSGGRFHMIAPSDLFKRGSFAGKSLPAARGADYATEVEKKQLQYAGRHTGCHHCGVRFTWTGASQQFVGDHIPPNKINETLKQTQHYFPQCLHCSSLQSHAVRLNKRTLVLPRAWRLHDLYLPQPLLLSPVSVALNQVYAEAKFRWSLEERIEPAKINASRFWSN